MGRSSAGMAWPLRTPCGCLMQFPICKQATACLHMENCMSGGLLLCKVYTASYMLVQLPRLTLYMQNLLSFITTCKS